MEPLIAHRNKHYSIPARAVNYAHSVSGGAGGRGITVSSVASPGLYGGGVRDSIYGGFSSGFSSGSTAVGSLSSSGFGSGSYDYQIKSSGTSSGSLAIGNEKLAMQHLNDRLASYLEMVRTLEKANSKLEIQIREAIEKKGPLEGKDYSKYEVVIADLRAKILDMTMGNAKLWISLDNARLASDDFRLKMEYELSMRQAVEADIAKLRKLLDDTNVIRMHLESDIESLKEELITLKRNHEIDVEELRAQISQVGIRVDVDAPKGHDLARIMEEMRAKYEKIALKNQEDLKAWHESQITEVQVQVNENTVALKEATTVVAETTRRYQALDIELQSALSQKASLEASLRDIEMRYNAELERYNAVILRLQEELSQIRTDIQQNGREYEHLLNIKVKLEAEIAEYRRLLDGGDLRLEDAVDHQKVVQTKVVTVTQTLVDGKVVSESKDVKSSEQVKN